MNAEPRLSPEKLQLLIVDDDKLFGVSIKDLFARDGVETTVANSLEAAQVHSRRQFDVILLDQRLPDGDGLDLLPSIEKSQAQVFLVTGEPGVDSAVQAMRSGCDDYFTKPIDVAELRQKVLDVAPRQKGSEMAPRRCRRVNPSSPQFCGGSPIHAELESKIDRAANTQLPVLLTGETGVGKSHIAKLIHTQQHPANDAPFVKVNCATLVPSLAEAELFGVIQGAYTGAATDRPGIVTAAHGGTLFLDEIGELSIGLQAKLLSFLDDRAIRPVGSYAERSVNTRIIAATNINLKKATQEGHFRLDLFYRLSVLELFIPSLRARSEDIPILAQGFLEQSSYHTQPRLDESCIDLLKCQALPGNARELRNWVERAVATQEGPVYYVEPPPEVAYEAETPLLVASVDSDLTLQSLEKAHILKVVDQFSNRLVAAQHLGISEATLRRKLRSYGIGRPN